MQTARIFTNGNSQAVRLPLEFRCDQDGDRCILLPMGYRENRLLGMLPENGPLDIEREQPAARHCS
jgi:antitoxin VapB